MGPDIHFPLPDNKLSLDMFIVHLMVFCRYIKNRISLVLQVYVYIAQVDSEGPHAVCSSIHNRRIRVLAWISMPSQCVPAIAEITPRFTRTAQLKFELIVVKIGRASCRDGVYR